jgi:mono/diheme cytochrome c family protein
MKGRRLALPAALVLWAAAGCQQTEPIPPYIGQNLYLGYCASCHGPVGRGDGPVAPSLVMQMDDLRTLTQRHGEFPREWLQEVIDGRTLRTAHGTMDMPVWGYQFRLVEPSDAYVQARIDALIDHIETLQVSD